jgi:hypothetical protein
MILIEVVIGLVFVYSLLAILVTQINAFIASLLNWRARQLKEGLMLLIADRTLQAEVLAHPLINMVEKTGAAMDSIQVVSAQQAEAIVTSAPTSVTYIDSKTFAEALVSILVVRAANDLYAPLRDAIETLPPSEGKDLLRDLFLDLQKDINDAKLRQIRRTVEPIPNNAAVLAALDQTEVAFASIRYRSEELAPLIAGAHNIESRAFRDALEVLLATARNIDDARSKFEAWFNDGMARTSNLYQSKLQFVSFAVGLALVVVMNIDTLAIGRALWEDQELRASVAQAAREFEAAQQEEQPPVTPTPTPETDASAPGTDASAPETDASAPETESATEAEAQLSLQDLEDQIEDIGVTTQQLLELQLPIGWEHVPVTDEMIAAAAAVGLSDPRTNARNLWNFWPGNNSGWLGLVVQKLIGWLTAAIAAAKGAPFWFDLLNKIARRG